MIVVTILAFLFSFLDCSAVAVLPRDYPSTLEEHFTPPELASQDAASPLYSQQKLADLDGLRLQMTDKGRIAKQ